jgi:hypothetical protein
LRTGEIKLNISKVHPETMIKHVLIVDLYIIQAKDIQHMVVHATSMERKITWQRPAKIISSSFIKKI